MADELHERFLQARDRLAEEQARAAEEETRQAPERARREAEARKGAELLSRAVDTFLTVMRNAGNPGTMQPRFHRPFRPWRRSFWARAWEVGGGSKPIPVYTGTKSTVWAYAGEYLLTSGQLLAHNGDPYPFGKHPDKDQYIIERLIRIVIDHGLEWPEG